MNVTLDGVPLAFEAAPVIENGRVMAPMRGILQPLGYTVQWNEAEQTVLAEKNGVSISLPIGRDTAVVNGSTVPLDAPARIIQERTFVPLRFLAEHSGAQVLWDGSTETVSIHSAIADDPTERMKESAVYIQTNKMQGSGIVLSGSGWLSSRIPSAASSMPPGARSSWRTLPDTSTVIPSLSSGKAFSLVFSATHCKIPS